MYRCPVCNKDNDGLLCPSCGFDGSCHYEQYPTLVSGISIASVSKRNAEYQAAHSSLVAQLRTAQPDMLLQCQKCGNVSFGFLHASNTLICTECNSLFPQLVYGHEYVEQLKESISRLEKMTAKPNPVTSASIPKNMTTPRQSPRRIDAASCYTLIVQDDGSVRILGSLMYSQRKEVEAWRNVVSVAAASHYSVGLLRDGTVVVAGSDFREMADVTFWRDIAAIAVSNTHIVGLRKDGTVVTAGDTAFGAGMVSDWKDIVAVSAMDFTTVGLRRDGTVVFAGDPSHKCDVSGWKDIVAISARYLHIVGLRKDGTVVAAGEKSQNRCDVDSWMDIIAVSAGAAYTLGLRRDGTVVSTGINNNGQCDLGHYREITAISAGNSHSVCLCKDGSLVAAGENNQGQCNVTGLRIKP